MTAIRLASLTGLRLGDLVKQEWSQVFEKQITIAKTGKRGGRAVIPIFPDLEALLDEIGRKDKGTVLLNSRGRKWTESGLESSWQKKNPKPKKSVGIPPGIQSLSHIPGIRLFQADHSGEESIPIQRAGSLGLSIVAA